MDVLWSYLACRPRNNTCDEKYVRIPWGSKDAKVIGHPQGAVRSLAACCWVESVMG